MTTEAARGAVAVSMLVLGLVMLIATGTVRRVHSWINDRVA